MMIMMHHAPVVCLLLVCIGKVIVNAFYYEYYYL